MRRGAEPALCCQPRPARHPGMMPWRQEPSDMSPSPELKSVKVSVPSPPLK
jgi:hypothetical protein